MVNEYGNANKCGFEFFGGVAYFVWLKFNLAEHYDDVFNFFVRLLAKVGRNNE